MKKSFRNRSLPLFFGLIIVSISLFGIQFSLLKGTNSDTRTRAAGNTKTVCPEGTPGCDFTGAAGIQQAIDAAGSGDIIVIQKGQYQSPSAIPMGLGSAIFVSAARGAADTCFIRIDSKNITLKGDNLQTVLFGEGHSHPDEMPYQTRAGVCVVNGGVTIDGIKIKEFQKRCLVSYNSTVIIKNSQVEGCDEGGASLLGNSAGLFVNNYFFSLGFGGVMLWQNSTAKIVNNTFWANQVLFFFHPGTNDQAKAVVDNNIFYNGWVAQVDWWASEAAGLNNSTYAYNDIWNDNNGACGNLEYCTAFPGKVVANPLFTAPVVDGCCGEAAWSDMSLQPGSPAVGSGDPSIPGPRNMGISGGPCADPSAGTCQSYIQSNYPSIPVILPPTQPPPPTQAPLPSQPPPPTQPPVPTGQPTLTPFPTLTAFPTRPAGTPVPTAGAIGLPGLPLNPGGPTQPQRGIPLPSISYYLGPTNSPNGPTYTPNGTQPTNYMPPAAGGYQPSSGNNQNQHGSGVNTGGNNLANNGNNSGNNNQGNSENNQGNNSPQGSSGANGSNSEGSNSLPAPTRPPIIDIAKTRENVKAGWTKFINFWLHVSRSILP